MYQISHLPKKKYHTNKNVIFLLKWSIVIEGKNYDTKKKRQKKININNTQSKHFLNIF